MRKLTCVLSFVNRVFYASFVVNVLNFIFFSIKEKKFDNVGNYLAVDTVIHKL